MQSADLDVCIIGGGLAGAALALSLAHLPLKIAVIEATAPVKNPRGPDNRTLALSHTSCQILDQLKIWPELKKFATPLKAVHVSEVGRLGIMRFTAEEYRLQALAYAISAEKLTRVLQEKVLAQEKILWLAPASLKNLTRNTNGYSVEIESAEQIKTYSTRLLVGADGTHSHTRKLLGIAVKKHDYHELAISTQISLSRDHNNIAYERFCVDGPLGLLPGEPKQCALVWVSKPEKTKALMELSDTDFCNALQKMWGYRLGKIQALGQRYAYPLISQISQKQILPHAVLLGNSAHTLHPIAAQGFNLSLRDTRALVTTIENALVAQQSPGDIQVLEKYLAKRTLEQKTLHFATHSLIHCFSTSLWPIPLGRNLTMFALNFLPKVRKWMANYGMGHI